MDEATVKLTIALKDTELDDEELDRTTRNLLQEMREQDEVKRADLVAVEKPPEGSKSLGGFLLGLLQAEVTIENIQRLFAFIGDRLGGQPIELEVEADGRRLKVKASSREELSAAIQEAQKFLAIP